MKRISTATKAVDLFGAGKHGWKDGNLLIAVQATDGEADWFNNLQEEVANVIESNGIALDGNVRTQLYQAIQAMIAGAANNAIKIPVRFTTTGNIVLSGLGTQAGGDWGDALTAGDRILGKDQATGADRGIYIAAAGAWARATDADGVGELLPGALVSVSEGVSLADSLWELSTDGPITIGTTALTFARKDAAAAGQQPGEVCYFARNTPPTGFLKANGALVSRATYASLFSAIGTTFGVGDGSTTFGLPELRGEFVRGWDDARGVDSGRGFGSAQAQDVQPHTHTVPVITSNSSGAGDIGITAAGANTTRTTGSSGTTETRPRNVALLACIKF